MKAFAIALPVFAVLAACAAQVPNAALRLPESTLEVRSMQTRTMAAPSEVDILTATIAVLQDMGYGVDRIEKPLGVITASKVIDADSGSEKTALFFLDALCVLSGSGDCDSMSTARDSQRITLTMVVQPSLGRGGEFSTRITIQRVIYDKMERIRLLERIDDAETYQQVFDNLRKALFIQVGEI